MLRLLVALAAAGIGLYVGWHETGYARNHTHHGPAAYISALGYAVALLGAVNAYDRWKRRHGHN